MNLGDGFKPEKIDNNKLEKFDKWILHLLNATIKKVDDALEGYRFNEAANTIYDFWWHEFCDWYVELVKQRIYGKENTGAESSHTAKQVLSHVLKKGLQLLHPFMPFITEEIWQKIKDQNEKDIIVSQWPVSNKNFEFENESRYTETFKEIVYKIRNIRGEMNIAPEKRADVIFRTDSALLCDIINTEALHLRALAKVESVKVDAQYIPDKTDASAVMADVEIFMPLKGLIDIEKEKARLEKELGRIGAELEKVNAKLTSKNFTGRAPADVIEKERLKQKEYSEILSMLKENISKLA